MECIRPTAVLNNDLDRYAECIGLTVSRQVWRFGALPGSDIAKYTGLQTDIFTWVISDNNGKVLATHEGWAAGLPARFKSIIDK